MYIPTTKERRHTNSSSQKQILSVYIFTDMNNKYKPKIKIPNEVVNTIVTSDIMLYKNIKLNSKPFWHSQVHCKNH